MKEYLDVWIYHNNTSSYRQNCHHNISPIIIRILHLGVSSRHITFQICEEKFNCIPPCSEVHVIDWKSKKFAAVWHANCGCQIGKYNNISGSFNRAVITIRYWISMFASSSNSIILHHVHCILLLLAYMTFDAQYIWYGAHPYCRRCSWGIKLYPINLIVAEMQ